LSPPANPAACQTPSPQASQVNHNHLSPNHSLLISCHTGTDSTSLNLVVARSDMFSVYAVLPEGLQKTMDVRLALAYCSEFV